MRLEDNMTPKKSLGQHWLHDHTTLQAIADHAGITPEDTVLEIGPGRGTLTHVLVATGANVIAVEYDNDLLNNLQNQFSGVESCQIVHGDIRTYDLTKLPDYKIVANIPYYLTSQLLRIIGDSTHPPKVAVLLVQKEVAERICANPPDMSILSVAVQYQYEVSLGELVPAALFTPPPKVDSQVVVLTSREQPLFNDIVKKDFMHMVKIGFAAKRKTLRNTLSGGLQLDKFQVDSLLLSVNIDPGRRAETLTLHEWYLATKAFEQLPKVSVN